ncbi:hypothetical protein DH2020_047398 [Rehmannia glutinosa]|uniref:Uncharacterized protein n=1 Tax=Rehmannia glutinosa TaxID=99300 RepID=A0ABR0U9I5_REHGL
MRKTLDTKPAAEEGDTTSSFHAGNCSSGKSKSKKKKRAYDDENSHRFVDLMASFCTKTDARLGDIANRIGFEKDVASSRNATNEENGKTRNQIAADFFRGSSWSEDEGNACYEMFFYLTAYPYDVVDPVLFNAVFTELARS